MQEGQSLVFEAEGSHFVGEVEDVAIVEGHVMTVATKDKQVVLEDNSGVTISSSRSLSLHVEDLSILVLALHRRDAIVLHRCAHRLSLSHLLVVLIKVAGVVIFDQERALHVF